MEIKGLLQVVVIALLVLSSASQVLIEPESHRVLPNTNVTSSCLLRGDNSHIHFYKPEEINFYHGSNMDSLTSYNIHIYYMRSQNLDGSYNYTWTVNMLASIDNNVTIFICIVTTPEEVPYHSMNSTIIAYNESITVSQYIHNSSMIEVSWGPIQHLPVINYTVTIYNISSNSTSRFVTHNTSLAIHSWTKCDQLRVTVTAHVMNDNSIGTITSNEITLQYPTELHPVNEKSIIIQVLKTRTNSIKTIIHFPPPDTCDYQLVHYNISIGNSSVTNHYPTITDTLMNIADHRLHENVSYSLTIKLWDNLTYNYMTTNSTFDTYFIIPSVEPCPTITVTDDRHIETSIAEPVPSSSAESITTKTTPVVTIISNVQDDDNDAVTGCHHNILQYDIIIPAGAGVGGFIIGIIMTLTFVCILKLIITRWKRIKKSQKNKEKNTVTQTVPVIPSMMASNPIYEGNNAVYEFLPQDIKTPQQMTTTTTTATTTTTTTGSNSSNGGRQQPPQLYIDIPPQVPAPRKMTLDSPGVKSGAELSLSKCFPIGLGDVPSNNGEEYICMKPTPRYTKAPPTSDLWKKQEFKGSASMETEENKDKT